MGKNTPQNSTWHNRPLRGRPPEFDDELGLLRVGRSRRGGPTSGAPFLLPLRSTAKPDDVAAEPRCPLARLADASAAGVEPASLHEDRSEIAHEVAQMAKAIAPGRRSSRISVRVSDERSGRVITTDQVVNGKRIQVQRRKPFAIFAG